MSHESAASADLNKLTIDRGERRDIVRRRRSPWPIIILILLIGVGAAGGFYYWKNEFSIPEITTSRVVLVTPSEGSAVLTASGYVVAQRKAILGAKSPRRLVERFANEGERVTENQIVARLDHTDVDARLAQAKASVAASLANVSKAQMAIARAEQELAEAKSRIIETQARRDGDEREVKRYREAEKAGAAVRKDREMAETTLAISTAAHETAKQQIKTAEANIEWLKKDFKSAEADVEVKRSEVAIAESAVEDTIIRAPFAGVILLKQAEVGESVSPGVVSGQVTSGSIFQIADFDTLEAEVDINEGNLSKVTSQQNCEIQVDAIPDRTFPGKLRILMPGANRQKGTVAAKVTFIERDARLKPELACKVVFLREAIQSRSAPKLLAPNAGVRKSGSQNVAYLFRDGKVTKRNIEIGDATGDRVEIRSGLAEGDEMIVNGPADLADGMKVKLKK
ncbi:MAG: efflux RND transporter periplasmic adaptor subunit [Planctomycetota bacterium]